MKILRRVRFACATGLILMVQTACVVAARDHGAPKFTCAGGYASQVTGDVGHSFSIDLDTLRARPNQTFVRDVFRTGTGARIIAPGDKGGARNVTHVARIRVLDPPG